MKKIHNLLSKPYFAYSVATCSAVVLYLVLSNLPVLKNSVQAVLKFFSPIFISIVVAYLFNPIACFFEKKVFFKIKKESSRYTAGVILTLICFVLVLALLLLALIPSIAKSVSALIGNWDTYRSQIQDIIEKTEEFLQKKNIDFDFSNLEDKFNSYVNNFFKLITENSKTIFNTIGNVGSTVSNFAVGVLFGFCFLFSKSKLLAVLSQIRSAVFKEDRIKANNVYFDNFNKILLDYCGCTLLDSLIVGIMTLVFMLIMRMPYAPLIAVIVAFTNIIPTFGPMIGAVIGMFFLFFTNPLNTLWFFIFMCVSQSVDGMLIKPLLFKDSLGMPGTWSLILIIVGGKIAGMMGIILSIPVGAMLIILYKETVLPKLKVRQNKINIAENTSD